MDIKIIGAHQNNLKNITLSLPRNRLVVITGVSGSGKSTLAFDTIFAEAQREYLESISTYSRARLPKIASPSVDAIEGLSPSIVLDQRLLARNPRSTVGTVTEIYTFLRLMFSRLSHVGLSASDFSFNTPRGACPTCKGLGVDLLPDLEQLLDIDRSLAEGAILHRTWRVGSRYWNILKAVSLFDLNKPLKDFSQKEMDLLLYSEPMQYQNSQPGYIQNFSFEGIVKRLIKRQGDSRGQAGKSYDQSFFSPDTCSECHGSRLNRRARSVLVNGKSIADLLALEIYELLPYIESLEDPIGESVIPYIHSMLQNLAMMKLGYLTLGRSVTTLSKGEAQRVRIARQLGSALIELIYVLDEPTAGLHPHDITYLTDTLRELVRKPNTVIVVEHDRSVMLNADYIVDMGPEAGVHGGWVVAQGTPTEIMHLSSVTGNYLSGRVVIPTRHTRRQVTEYLDVRNARLHNLKDVSVRFPLMTLTCITGVSGSGKSSLVEVLLRRYPQIIVVDQSPPGTIPRSNPATYTKVFDEIRKEFARATGQSPSLFSFNSEGACEACQGLGYQTIDMHFLGDMRQICEECQGKRFNVNTLKYCYKGKTIADVLDMTAIEALDFFDNAIIQADLALLNDVGLGYLCLGQPLDTLSGGEAQRIKLVSRLSLRGNIYILDEPTRGLHFVDIDRLLTVLNRLVDSGNTVVVVEHNLDVIKNADWIIDIGPGSGKDGGEIIVEGAPETVAACSQSLTGFYLADALRHTEQVGL